MCVCIKLHSRIPLSCCYSCLIDLNGWRTSWNWSALEPWHPSCPPATEPRLKQPQQLHHWLVKELQTASGKKAVQLCKSLQHTANAAKRMIGASFITLEHLEHPPHTEQHSASLMTPPTHPSSGLSSSVLGQTLKLLFNWDHNVICPLLYTPVYHNIKEWSKLFWLHLKHYINHNVYIC